LEKKKEEMATYNSTLEAVPAQNTARYFSQTQNNLPTSALIQMYLSPQNMEYVAGAIAQSMKCLTGLNFQVPINQELQLAMENVLQNNIGMWTSDPEDGVAELNRHVIESETQIQLFSYRQHMLYDKYFITQDRQRVEDRPIYQTVKRGEVLIDPSEAYMLQSPWKKQHKEFTKMFDSPCHFGGDWKVAEVALKQGCNPSEISARYQISEPAVMQLRSQMRL